MVDFTSNKITTYQGIHDEPREPTIEQGANSSHLIARFNVFVEACQAGINLIEQRLTEIEQSFETTNIINQELFFSTDDRTTAYDLGIAIINGLLLEVFVEGLADPEPFSLQVNGTNIDFEPVEFIDPEFIFRAVEPQYQVAEGDIITANYPGSNGVDIIVSLGIEPTQ